jgi:hypothetical protein
MGLANEGARRQPFEILGQPGISAAAPERFLKVVEELLFAGPLVGGSKGPEPYRYCDAPRLRAELDDLRVIEVEIRLNRAWVHAAASSEKRTLLRRKLASVRAGAVRPSVERRPRCPRELC